MIVFAYVSTILRHYAKAANSRHILTAIFVIADFVACRIGPGAAGAAPVRLDHPLIVTQLPASDGLGAGQQLSVGRPWPADQPARLALVYPDSSSRSFIHGFYSACNPEVSFDAARVLFAGRKRADDDWNIYEATLDGRTVRQITKDLGNCRSPCYQGTLYTLDSSAPWHQITFVSDRSRVWNECGSAPLTNLYSCKLDGSGLRQLTFNLSNDADPSLLGDGRLIFTSWQRCTLERGRLGYARVFAVNLDGTDYALFAEDRGKPCKRMPCATTKGMVVFVESNTESGDGGGILASVTVRRPLRSYRPITQDSDGRFRCPAPLPDGRVLVCRQAADGKGVYGVCRLDPVSGACETVFRDPRFHTVEARLVCPRAEPDGRSSNVREEDASGKFYCLDVYCSDLRHPAEMARGTAKRLRVMEGVPRPIAFGEGLPTPPPRPSLARSETGHNRGTAQPMAPRRILGEVAVEEDGSFNIVVPANTPIQLQLLDDRGMALRSCAWIWAKNHESRGCIGCHEDGEWVPDNRFAQALGKASVVVAAGPRPATQSTRYPPGTPRRTPDFHRDVLPIVRDKCMDCHRNGQSPPYFAAAPNPAEAERTARQVYNQLLASAGSGTPQSAYGKYVHPGKARTSPLAWHLFGQDTSRPWDAPARGGAWKPIPASARSMSGTMHPWSRSASLTADDKRAFVEWIDTGAAWDSPQVRRDAEEKEAAGKGGAQERGGR